MFPRPFPLLNEDRPSPTHSGAPLPVQHNSFLDSVRPGRRNKEYCEVLFHCFCAGLTPWIGERIRYGDVAETWAS